MFSCERPHGRAFMAASIERFYDEYLALPATMRHHYEIIRAGQPCNMYFGARRSMDLCEGRGASRVQQASHDPYTLHLTLRFTVPLATRPALA